MFTSRFIQLLGLGALMLSLTFCSKATNATSVTSPTTSSVDASGALPAIYSKFGNGVQVSLDGQTVVLKTTDVPDHPSPYFGVGNAGYEAPQPGMMVNPNRIS